MMLKANEYRDHESLFCLDLPEGWAPDASGQFGARVVFFCPDVEAGFRANVNVVVNSVGPLTFDEFIEMNRLQLKLLAGVASLPTDERLGDGLHEFTWENVQGPTPLIVRQHLIFSKGKIFTVTATSLPDQTERYQAAINCMFGSFRVL